MTSRNERRESKVSLSPTGVTHSPGYGHFGLDPIVAPLLQASITAWLYARKWFPHTKILHCPPRAKVRNKRNKAQGASEV